MKDLKLDFQNKKMLNATVDEKERVHQQIIVGVRSFLGDFFLNDNYGINYSNCWSNPNLTKIFIKEQIEAISGVISVASIEVKKSTDKYKTLIINATVKTEYAQLNIEQEIYY